ncbi:MAG TPA: SDR family NAD(P)-dependent oxidoreductase [Candidatus Sulfotelmatobacter sp.]|nr:SDR family NAD(P)-dependent oxidoreductase [Candidatus Sulfotelmatobacter sp.]
MAALSDQFAVVTGAGSGIGRAIATALGGQGATVGLVGRTQAKLQDAAAGFATNGRAPVVLPTDLSADEQQDALKAEVERRFGQVDVLVMCAGEIAHGPVESAPVADFDKLYRANVRANYRLVQNLLPMLRKRPGQIVFINSSVGLSARPNVAQFSATQHALRALTDALRAEVNADGIRVLSVYPGRVATPRQEKLYAKQANDYKPELLLQPEDIASIVLSALTLPRTAEVTEISIRPLAKSY